MSTLPAQLRALRLNAGLTQAQLAEALGISQPTVSGAERGTPTTTDVVERWVARCDGVIITAANDAAGRLFAAIGSLSGPDLAQLERIARALPSAPAATKEGIVLALEALAQRPSPA